ncbi:MAG: thioredoxin-disulfide reductase [Deltaproteobacteria bacterium]|nr:thioredoxin-disulfide reductase [Deltaproteobacteria bacterium]
MTDSIRNVVIIGSGPAGWTAALYTGRANLRPLVYEGASPNTPGGQLMITSEVENFPGHPDGVTGPELMEKIKAQAIKFDVDVKSENVVEVDLQNRPFTIKGSDGEIVKAHAVIISTGANARLLGTPGEEELMSSGGGVSACATCDGAFYKEQNVVVVGGGDTAMEEAIFLTRYAKKVTLVHRRDEFRSSKIMLDRARANEKIEILTNYTIKGYQTEMQGMGMLKRPMLTAVELGSTNGGEDKVLDATGCFIAIGHAPTTALFGGQLKTDETGYLITEGKSSRTELAGVFACGDVQDHVYRQAITAAGTGCMAAIDTERFLESEGL